ncbi:MAG: AraC family transcriptional regulator [Chthoniobacterales bacterium]|nr:AraC family transcriptional regulator [Chthoniobacterales bacterium]
MALAAPQPNDFFGFVHWQIRLNFDENTIFRTVQNTVLLTRNSISLMKMPKEKHPSKTFEPDVAGVMDTLFIETVGHMPRKANRVDTAFGFEGFGLVLRGRGFFQVGDGERRELIAPSVFYIWPGPRFHYGPAPGTVWDERWICFSGQRVKDWRRWGWLARPGEPVALAETESLVQLHRRIVSAFGPAKQLPLDETKLEAERMVWLLHRAALATTRRPDAITRLIEDWTASPPKRADLRGTAARLQMSYSAFRSKFFEQAGTGPYQFLLRLRIDAAARRLLESDLPLKAVAQDAGFGHIESFCRAFLRIKGMSPGVFRKRFLAFRGIAPG